MATECIAIRPARWPEDVSALVELDTSFHSDRLYTLRRDEWSFELNLEVASPPISKKYPFDPSDPVEQSCWDLALVAEVPAAAGRPPSVVGFVGAELAQWNRRVVIHHLYVSPGYRRHGLGGCLLNSAESFAVAMDARCLWLETQNVNYPAIRFYLRHGFSLCGFDESLYDPEQVDAREIGVFMVRHVQKQGAL